LPDKPLAVQLVIHIDSLPYQLAPLPADPAVASRVWMLRRLITGPRNDHECDTYNVSQTAGHYLECECKGFLRWGSSRGPCKHIKALVSVGLVDAPEVLARKRQEEAERAAYDNAQEAAHRSAAQQARRDPDGFAQHQADVEAAFTPRLKDRAADLNHF
jgi:hypothetical protein